METDNINDLVNHSIKDFILPEYIPEIETYLNNVSAQPGMHKREIQIKTLRNNIRWIELRSVLIQLADTSPRIMSIIVDHSERKHAQELLAERQQELTHIMRLNTLGEMASGIAHELNQPLAAIANYIRGCERRMHENACTIDEITEVMQRVNIQVRRAGDILRYAKDFTRKDQNLERHAQDINLIVQDTLSLLETLEHFKEIKLITELDHNLNLVNVNKIQIEQVLINMLQNAMDAMQEAGTLNSGTLRVRTQAEFNHSLRVLVVDEGTGLAPDFANNIFRPFYTSKQNGMGMGLSISRSIIEAHGGKLEAFNNRHKGATFSFTLPLEGSALL